MAQDLTVNIKTTSDVPKAMEKSKTAVVSFSKQVEDIQKKFSTAFKDIFLGFTAPMVLLQGAISYISSSIAESKRMAKEGLDLIAAGETKFASTEEQRAAAFFKRRKEIEEEKKLVEAGKTDITKQILSNPGGMFRDFNLPEAYVRKLREGSESIQSLSQNADVQRLAMEYFQTTEEGKKIAATLAQEQAAAAKPGSFKGPEGFGTVIGVGANPVMEAMTRNNEILEEIKIILQEQSIQNRTGQGVPPPFTDRVVPLSAAKEGVA
jgi:hypothetical protein